MLFAILPTLLAISAFVSATAASSPCDNDPIVDIYHYVPTAATRFCVQYIDAGEAAATAIALPGFLPPFPPARISFACSCILRLRPTRRTSITSSTRVSTTPTTTPSTTSSSSFICPTLTPITITGQAVIITAAGNITTATATVTVTSTSTTTITEAVTCSPTNCPKQVVNNPSFDQSPLDLAGWDKSEAPHFQLNPVLVREDKIPGGAHTGFYAGAFVSATNATGPTVGRITQTLSPLPARCPGAYIGTVWVKTLENRCDVILGHGMESLQVSIGPNSGWKQVSHKLNLSDSEVSYLTVMARCDGPETVWFDDVTLVPAERMDCSCGKPT